MPENGFDAACYLAKLRDAEWQSHINALTAFAARVVFRFYWNTPSGLPEARTVEDFVLESIGGLCLHPHRWKHTRQRHRTMEAKLLAYLKMDLYRNMAGRAGGADNAIRIPDGDPVITGTPYSRSSPEDEVTARERRELVARMRRTEKDLELFDLHYLEGLKPSEISDRLGRPVSLVNSQLGEMRKRLRKRFRAEYKKYFPREDS
ncbi:sigma-70 family RNA polymerase sigma factor [bacterium]|nr:sigma-70 family RNA polymerase sigma factor [bacterium]